MKLTKGEIAGFVAMFAIAIWKFAVPPINGCIDGRDLLLWIVGACVIVSMFFTSDDKVTQANIEIAKPYLQTGEPFAFVDNKNRVFLCSKNALPLIKEQGLVLKSDCQVI